MFKRFKKCLDLEKSYIHVDNDASYFTERDGCKLTIYLEWSNGKVDWINNFDFMPEYRHGFKGFLKRCVAWIKEFIFNIQTPKKSYKDMPDSWRCHGGFLKVWKSIEPHLVELINNPMIKEFEIIGYSHGGGVAQLCHEYIKYWRPDAKVTGYGFGAPRIFWGTASDSVKKRFEGFTVIRNGNDLITHLPPKLFGFKDICTVVTVGEKIGPIKDHYPERYLEALEKYMEVADNVAG